MRLHQNAAQRVLRREMTELTIARKVLLESKDDPRIPAGVVSEQVAQIDRESAELAEALAMLERQADLRRRRI